MSLSVLLSDALFLILYLCFMFSVEVTEDGKRALLNLAKGDMRKVLNVLQSTVMAFDKVTEANVYMCVGYPSKQDVEQILKALLAGASIEQSFQGKRERMS